MATFGEAEEVTLTTAGTLDIGGSAADELLSTGTKHSPFQEGVRFNLRGVAAVPIINDDGKVTSKRLVARIAVEGSDTISNLFFSTICRDIYDDKGNLVDKFTTDKNSFGRSVNDVDVKEGAVGLVKLLTSDENKNKVLVCHRLSYTKEGGKKATWVALAWG